MRSTLRVPYVGEGIWQADGQVWTERLDNGQVVVAMPYEEVRTMSVREFSEWSSKEGIILG